MATVAPPPGSSSGGGGATTDSTTTAGGGNGGGATATNAAATAAAAAGASGTSKKNAAAAANGGDGGGVPVQAVAMKLLDLRLKPSTAIIQSVVGEFTADAVAAGQQEIAMLKSGGTLEIHRVVNQTTKTTTKTSKPEKKNDDDKEEEEEEEEEESKTFLKLITRVDTKSILRSLAVIRFPGQKRDVLALGADGGALSILDLEKSGSFQVIHCVDFGKTGCRRATPGQYLAVDPKGRALMIASIEKRKLVYVLNRDASGNPTIASPLEAHRPRTITFDSVGIDNGYDNPIFATLELQYQDTNDHQVSVSSDDVGHGGNNGNNKGGGDNVVDVDVNSTEHQLLNKQLAYYELDLGRNFVSRRWAASVHPTACCLAALPGGADGPGGVLVGGEDWIEYLHESMSTSTTTGSEGASSSSSSSLTWNKITCPIPRRKLHPPNKGILITTITVQRQKKLKFFALAQSELGDVYKITIQLDPHDQMSVKSLQVALVDTLPTANSLNVCKKLGMLFCAAEFGDHFLYQFDHIDLPDAPTSNSLDVVKAFAESSPPPPPLSKSSTMTPAQAAAVAFLTTATASKLAPTFTPTTLRNLHKVFTLDNASPTTSIMVGELAGNEVSPQIYTLTGRGPTSAMRITRHGASISELAVSELPGVPGGIFTVADNTNPASSNHNQKDRFIVVSFADATLVLSVGETVEEVGKESGFVTNSPTLACSALGNDGALCQVHPAGVRHIQKGNAKKWDCPGLKRIECASANQSQVMIALAGGEVIIFELDPMSGNLIESATRDLRADVFCLDVGTIPQGRSRSLFAAIGCRDQTVRIVSLEPGSLLVQRSSTALKSRPHSVSLTNFVPAATTDGGNKAGDGVDDLALVIGLDDGSCLRASVDPVTGAIGTSPTRRFLGARPVSVSRITLNSTPATLLLSSRPWIGRRDATTGKHVMAPLSYVPLDHGCCFSTDVVREGIVATAGKTLRILSVDSSAIDGGDDEAFNTRKVELRYTPRQMTLLSAAVGTATGDQRKIFLAAVESDCNDYGQDEKNAMGFDFTGEGKAAKAKVAKADDAMDVDSDDEDAKKEEKDKATDDDEEEEEEEEIDPEEKEARKTVIRGPVPPTPGHWGSCVRLMNPADNCATLDCVEMGRNEAALCCASVRFHSKGGEPLLAVGTVTGMTLHPLKQAASHVVLYRVVAGERLQLVHRTSVDDGPVLALSHFQGRLLVGIGRSLRLYEMGRRQLLRKCELRGLPTYVKTLQTVGDRAYVGDMMQSVQIVRYEATSNRLVLIANDPSPRPIVCQELLDWNTVAVGDKFGNISVLRLPRGADANAIDPTGHRVLWDSSRMDTTPKLELLCQYYLGEVVTSMTRSSLVAGGPESLIYATVGGRIGALVPFTSRDDVDFYTQLESCLRADAERPTGRDPQEYRSYYAPIMHVVDGDLCDSFNALPYEAQNKIAEGLDRTIGAIKKKLEDKRNALL